MPFSARISEPACSDGGRVWTRLVDVVEPEEALDSERECTFDLDPDLALGLDGWLDSSGSNAAAIAPAMATAAATNAGATGPRLSYAYLAGGGEAFDEECG